MQLRILSWAAAGVLLLLSAPVSAQTKPAAPVQPGVTTATYQDWVLRCVTRQEGARLCEIVQNLQAEGQGMVASIAIGRAAPKGPVNLVIQLPPGVWLPAGVKVEVGEKAKPIQLVFQTCPQGCFAEAALEPAALQQLRTAAGPGRFTFENGARQAVTLPISFNGLAAALDAGLKL